MLTPDEIRAISLFSTLPDAELERLAQTSADLHLCPGEYAVHEGGERALYAVLSGKMEVVKLFDGVERTLGWRVPGTIFGEVPLALSSPFPGAYRAAEPSRVMRVDAQHYYALAAVSPDVATRMGALARERIGGLQGLSAEPPKTRVTLVGAEKHFPPMDRPPLSKKFLREQSPGDALRIAPDLDVDLRLACEATGLDPSAREVSLDDGSRLSYDGLVVATGATVRRLPGT